jgi:hypothetical protein
MSRILEREGVFLLRSAYGLRSLIFDPPIFDAKKTERPMLKLLGFCRFRLEV